MRRVVITGAGCITSIGQTVAAFADALFAGRTGLSPVALEPGQKLAFSAAAQVHDFAPTLPDATLLVTERSARFALAATRQAVESSGVLHNLDPAQCAVYMGCSVGGRTADEPEVVKLFRDNGRVHPFTIPRVMASSGASQISMAWNLTGPALTFSTACASSAHAIGHAFHAVRAGLVPCALAGGHEAPLTYGFLKAWEAMRVVSPAGCRPFSAQRDGMTLGEGAATLVLEDRDHALARSAEILAEIVGFGMSSDGNHITQPTPAGPAAALRAALADARATPEEVGYINAHGTGTDRNDAAESEAIRTVFGAHTAQVAVSSTKAQHGHTIGAAGAIEALATVLSLHGGRLPASIGCDPLDPTLGITILREPRATRVPLALSNSFAFGGLNAVLAFRPA